MRQSAAVAKPLRLGVPTRFLPEAGRDSVLELLGRPGVTPCSTLIAPI